MTLRSTARLRVTKNSGSRGTNRNILVREDSTDNDSMSCETFENMGRVGLK